MADAIAPLEQILELARWAPSGDNTQPWRFEITGDRALTIHGFDTRTHCVYDFDGRASQISLGALLQTVEIAASAHGLRTDICRRRECPEDRPTFDLRFAPDAAIAPSPLLASITARTVQRRAMSSTPIPPETKAQLSEILGAAYQLRWWEPFHARLRIARLLFRSAKLRLTMPEAYEVHRDAIQFDAQFSEDRIPDQAVGLDPLATRIMRWTMQSWPRLRFFNTYLGGTLLPRIELDFIPGIACAAHFAVIAREQPASIDDYANAGRAVQRLWLQATAQSHYVQPQMTPLIFSWYVRSGRRFSRVPALWDHAVELAPAVQALLGENCVFFGRIGAGPAPVSRSLRRPLETLLVSPESPASMDQC